MFEIFHEQKCVHLHYYSNLISNRREKIETFVTDGHCSQVIKTNLPWSAWGCFFCLHESPTLIVKATLPHSPLLITKDKFCPQCHWKCWWNSMNRACPEANPASDLNSNFITKE